MSSTDVAQQHRAFVEARGLFRSFGRTPALRGAGVAVDNGEILAVMGPSGSGKSTLLHCLAGIFKPDQGEVWFDGRRIDDLSEGARTQLRRRAFGFVFQFGQLVPELTSADNVALPLLLNREAVRRPTVRQAPGWNASGWAAWRAAGPGSSRAGRHRGWRWPGRLSSAPR